jgi:Lipopolysaccharide-assembly
VAIPRPSLRALRLPVLAAILVLAGCAHYELGTGSRLAFSSIYVEPVENRTRLPQAQAVVSSGLRDAFAKDGRLALAPSAGSADATLTVVLSEYRRDVAAVREADTGLASKFAVTLTALCTLRDNRTGRAYFERRPVSVERDVFTDSGNPWSPLTGDQPQAEYNNVPLLAQSLGGRVAHAVLDTW